MPRVLQRDLARGAACRSRAAALLKEPQGEGLALGSGGTVYLAGEGGEEKQPGTFVQFACAVSQ